MLRRTCECILLLVLACSLYRCAPARGETLMLDLATVKATNIPKIENCLKGGAFTFASAEEKPAGGDYFFVRFGFSVPAAGWYRLVIVGPGSGGRGHSQYSYVLDGGKVQPALRAERQTAENPLSIKESVQPPVKLAGGAHTVEFRFSPEERLHEMNRVDAGIVGHNVQITAVRIEPAEAVKPHAPAPASNGFRLRSGDSVVLFGDSITEEGLYPQHFVRLLEKAFPERRITVYNSGISLNRSWEGAARLERDVIDLHPTWAVFTFGVNDAMHRSPEVFRAQNVDMLQRLRKAGIGVLLATPSGMLPEAYLTEMALHTPDRGGGFDLTMAMESRVITELAREYRCPCADVYGAFTRAGFPRSSLMANQWHPNAEGGRVYALELLRALGFTRQDAERSGDAKDLAVYDALANMPAPDYPAYRPTPFSTGNLKGKIVCAGAFAENMVYAFSADTGKMLARVPVGHHPMGMAYSAKRRELYVACEGSGTIDIISLPSFTRVHSIPLGDIYPLSISLSPDENTAWTGNFFGSGISEVDLQARRLLRTITLPGIVSGAWLAPEQHTVLASVGGKVAFVSTETGKVQATVPASNYAAAFYRDAGGRLYVMDTAQWTMRPVDFAKQALLDPVPVPVKSRALAIDPETRALWAGDCAQGQIVKLNPGTTTPQPVATIAFPMGIAVFTVD